ncbi:MAG: hypothetical protein CMN31_28245 [Sandaracinus sp.]|nr:hypothetical protein [Myxococcales bacterium]MBJ75177.1 hypothetical protein [Sandaracinus sp.]
MTRHTIAVPIACSLLLLGCGGEPSCPSPFVEDEARTSCVCPEGFVATGTDCIELDAGADGGADVDAGSTADAGSSLDAGSDGGPSVRDAGMDASSGSDGGGIDAGSSEDAGPTDAGATDAGPLGECGCPLGTFLDCRQPDDVDAGPRLLTEPECDADAGTATCLVCNLREGDLGDCAEGTIREEPDWRVCVPF